MVTNSKPKLKKFKGIPTKESDLELVLHNASTKSTQLLHLMHELAKANSTSKIMELICLKTLKIFAVERSAIYLPDEDRKNLILHSSKNKTTYLDEQLESSKLLKKVSLNSEYTLVKSFQTGQTMLARRQIPVVMRKVGIKTTFFFPMISKGEVRGVLAMSAGKNYISTEEDLRIGQLLALHLSVKLDNRNLLESQIEQRNRLELVQNSINEGLSLHGPDGVIYYANKKIAHFFGNTRSTVGVSREELVKNWKKYHKYEIERYFDTKQMNKNVYEEKKPFLNGLMKVKSNPERFIEANYYPVIRNGEFAGMAASYRDVTKEKKQEKDLEKNLSGIKTEKERWEAIFTNVDEGICLIDKDFKVIHMNSACESNSGWALEDAKGKPYYSIFDCHTKNGLRYPDFSPLEKVLITKEPLAYEEHMHTNSPGEEVWVGVSASPIKNQNGEIEEIVLVIRDISAIKEVEKAKSEFVSIASHELRTPLTVINGYLSLLINGDLGDFKDSESREKLQVVLNKVASETTRLTTLVSDLLNVSRIEEKRIQLNKQNHSVEEVVREVLEKLSTVAGEKNISLRFDGPNLETATLANFDKDKISQVLLNLVDNAIKFTPENGFVTIRSWKESNDIFVSIEDNGIGIPKKLLPIVFEKFQQVPGSYLKENRGTGLGLFIVKSLVELHNGEIIVDSTPGKGSRFTFSIPTAVA